MTGRVAPAAVIALTVICAAAAPGTAAGQSAGQASMGPVIRAFGPVYDIEAPDLSTDLEHDYRVVFDVKSAASEPTAVNPGIETLARFLNMHARAGVPVAQMHLALVLHGAAGKDALGDEGFRARHGVDNPNLPLLDELAAAGVQIYLCGQTSAHRGLGRDELAPPVEVALSAMTALVMLQAEGYALIAF